MSGEGPGTPLLGALGMLALGDGGSWDRWTRQGHLPRERRSARTPVSRRSSSSSTSRRPCTVPPKRSIASSTTPWQRGGRRSFGQASSPPPWPPWLLTTSTGFPLSSAFSPKPMQMATMRWSPSPSPCAPAWTRPESISRPPWMQTPTSPAPPCCSSPLTATSSRA